MRYKKVFVIILCVLIYLSFVACIDISTPATPSWKGGPKSGLWYCEELKMQLFIKELNHADEKALRDGTLDSQSYVIADDKPVMCILSTSAVSGEHSVHVCSLKLGQEQTYLDAELVGLNETTWSVQDDIGKNYTFTRVNEFALSEYVENIETYSDNVNVGEVHHVEIAAEKALQLWEKELDADSLWQREDVTVSFSFEDQCWLIVATSSENTSEQTYNALIKKNGDVIAVWM